MRSNGVEENRKCDRSAVRMLLGNKVDLKREVGSEEGEAFASSWRMLFGEVSAKEALNIDRCLGELVEGILQQRSV